MGFGVFTAEDGTAGNSTSSRCEEAAISAASAAGAEWALLRASIESNFSAHSTHTLCACHVEIAEMMGVKQPQVSNWLNGKRIPTASNLIKLADILEEYPEDLLDKLEVIKQENNF